MVILTLLLGRVKQGIYLLQIESEYNAPLPTGHPSIANIYYTRTTHAHDASCRASAYVRIAHAGRPWSSRTTMIELNMKSEVEKMEFTAVCYLIKMVMIRAHTLECTQQAWVSGNTNSFVGKS